MTDTFDPTKPCRTRDGREVRILCTDAPGGKPIVGYAIYEDGGASAYTWFSHGGFMKNEYSDIDLMNTPERVTRWIGVNGPDIITSGCQLPLQDWPHNIELTFEDGKLIETKIHEA